MKDLTISAKRIKTELYWLLACTIFAVLLNFYSVIRFKTSWSELITSMHIVLLMSLVIYVLVLFVRGLIGLIMRFSTGKRGDNE